MTTSTRSFSLLYTDLGGKGDFSVLETLGLWRMETGDSFFLGEAWSRDLFPFSAGFRGVWGEDSSFWSYILDIFLEDLRSYFDIQLCLH